MHLTGLEMGAATAKRQGRAIQWQRDIKGTVASEAPTPRFTLGFVLGHPVRLILGGLRSHRNG